MAHQAVDTRLAQPACEAANTKDHKETAHTLRELWKSTAVLRNVLEQDRSINDLELRLLENQFHVLRMAYRGAKQKLGA